MDLPGSLSNGRSLGKGSGIPAGTIGGFRRGALTGTSGGKSSGPIGPCPGGGGCNIGGAVTDGGGTGGSTGGAEVSGGWFCCIWIHCFASAAQSTVNKNKEYLILSYFTFNCEKDKTTLKFIILLETILRGVGGR